jgi:hypothetical protein
VRVDMGKSKCYGIAEIASLIIIAACFIVGGYFMIKSEEVDHPVEEIVEDILETQGIDVDFSESKKV